VRDRQKHGQSSWQLHCLLCVCYFNASVPCILFNTLRKIKETPPKAAGPLPTLRRTRIHRVLGNVNINIKTRNDSQPLAPEEVPLCDSNPPPLPQSTSARRVTRSTRRLSASRTCLSVTTNFRANWSFPKETNVGYPKAVL
jgi:hypothetical protein